MSFHVLRSDRAELVADCPALPEARAALFAALLTECEASGVIITDDFKAVLQMDADKAEPGEGFTVGPLFFTIAPAPLLVDRP